MLGQTIIIQRKFEPVDWLRLVDKYQVTSTFSAPPPIRLVCSAARRGQGAATTGRSMRMMLANAAPWTFRAQADLPGRLPAGLAVGGLRIDRARRELRPRARGPAAQARLVRQASAPVSRSAARRRRQRRHRHRPDHSGELYVSVQPRCSPTYYKQHDKLPRPPCAATSTPSATSPTGTTRATTTSATARSDMIISGGMNIYPAEIEARARTASRHLRRRGLRDPLRAMG